MCPDSIYELRIFPVISYVSAGPPSEWEDLLRDTQPAELPKQLWPYLSN